MATLVEIIVGWEVTCQIMQGLMISGFLIHLFVMRDNKLIKNKVGLQIPFEN